ncbi:hypothetical protein GGQ61_000316 [Phenylobacterium haematophilum]|uniref:Uncharacterized protein n=1 Tax=Phenylobacterium haematophilum TaxID=98513 RepID=A0A839ZV15_9CAUL|nr:hypothetical protein [Phenylobacterium haematophilum]
MDIATDTHLVLNANLSTVSHVRLPHARRPFVQNA